MGPYVVADGVYVAAPRKRFAAVQLAVAAALVDTSSSRGP